MNNLSEELMAQLNNKISFVIPVFGGIPVPESTVVTWFIMALLVVFSVIFTRNLKIKPTRSQAFVEMLVGGLNGFFEGILGEEGKAFFPYLGTVALYLGVANVIGLFGITPPTKDLNVTAGLAIMSIILVLGAGIRFKGVKGWLKSYAEPLPLIAPINVLEIFIRPLSLCMRLFGNVLGAFVIMEFIKIIAPVALPIPFSLYFDVFDGIIQAVVFVFLTSLFIKEAVE
ncbi:MAG: F0F1 ATP synthase subunit A [Clostridia bacterium]|nr:F0F1 ATP synthase subunit A [Clostridia bacterium]